MAGLWGLHVGADESVMYLKGSHSLSRPLDQRRVLVQQRQLHRPKVPEYRIPVLVVNRAPVDLA